MLLILIFISIYQSQKSSPQSQLQWPSPREGGTAAVFCLTRCPTHLIAPAAELPTPFQPNWDYNVIVDGLAFILISSQKRIKEPCLHVALSCLEQFQPNWDKSMILHMVQQIFVFNNVALISLVTTDSVATCSESLGQPGVCKTWSVFPPSLQSHRTQRDITLSLTSVY